MPYIRKSQQLRVKTELSQSKFARLAKVDRQTLSRCERGYSIHDVSCGKIETALKKAGIPSSEIVIVAGGKIGEMPRKGKKRAVSGTQAEQQPKP